MDRDAKVKRSFTSADSGTAATLPEKLRAKAWLLLRRREATFEDEAAANLMLRAAKALEADRAAS